MGRYRPGGDGRKKSKRSTIVPRMIEIREGRRGAFCDTFRTDDRALEGPRHGSLRAVLILHQISVVAEPTLWS